MTVRLGLLSTAAIDGAILGARTDDAPFTVDAVGSRDAERAHAYAAAHGVERAQGSYDALLADDALDAVYIALPNALHHEWTMRAAGSRCYCVSAARLVAGHEPSAVRGERVLGRGGVDERFVGTLRFGDMLATFACGFTSHANRIDVYGADGVISVPQAFVDPPGLVVLNGEEHRVDPGNQYRAELDDFCAAVRGEHPPLLGRDEMLGQARTPDALWQSAS